MTGSGRLPGGCEQSEHRHDDIVPIDPDPLGRPPLPSPRVDPVVDMDSSEASLLVLRHGQSLWNARAKWQGSADIDLSDLGREQARRAAIALIDADLRFAGVVSSQLSRAAETARIIAAHLDLDAPFIDDRWREAHAGEWQGLTPDEIRRDWPGFLEEHRRPPGFEPVEGVVQRTSETALELLRSAAGGPPVLVVSHSDNDHSGGTGAVLAGIDVERVMAGEPEKLTARSGTSDRSVTPTAAAKPPH